LTPLDSYAVDYFAANASGNTAAALKAAAAASDIAPQSEWSWNAGFMLMPMNRPRETLKYFSRLDPDRGWMRNGWEYYWYLRAQIMHMLGDFKGTHAWLTRARRKFPESVPIAAAYARSLALNGQPDSLVVITKQILQSTIGWRAFYAYSIIEDLRRHGHLREQRIVFDVMSTWYEGLGRNATEDDRRNFGSALLSMGLDSLAEQHYKALYAASRKSGWRTSYTGQLARLAAKRGDTAAASRIIELVPEADEQWSGEKNYWRAQVAAELGQRENAVRLLRAAFDKGLPQMSLSHSDWYDFPKLQGYPPFEALVNSTR
jgi:tetratricopeptide (TPR) repeat protein